MKKRLLLLLSVALLSTLNLFANKDFRYEDAKRFEKKYQCSETVLLEITNKYGNVNVEQWDKNEVKINVDITVKANSQREVDRILELISVSFESSRSRVSAVTMIDNNLKTNNASMSISYQVLVPRKASMNLNNKYGNVYVVQCNGRFSSDVKYGNLSIDKLNSTDVKMVSKYGNININSGNSSYANIDIAYGRVVIDSFGNLDITSRYGGLKANRVGNINVSSKYDDYDIENCSTINITEGGYTKYKIGNLKTSFTAADGSVRYGNVKIGGITSNIKQIKLNCSYTNVSLTFVEKGDYNFDLFCSYGGIKIDESALVKFNIKIVNDGSRSVVGYSKTNSEKSVINIKNKYSNININ